MAQNINLLLSATFLLLFLVQGTRSSGKCAPLDVDVELVNTGQKVGFDPVFEVTVRNRCGCALRALYLRSEGFSSLVAVDPRLFRRDGQDYLVNDGRRIESSATVKFRYAWDRAFNMVPASVKDDCS